MNGYNVYKCKQCGLIFTYPIPDEKVLDEYYNKFAYNEDLKKYKDELLEVMRKAIHEKLQVVQKVSDVPLKKLLDIGCGCGYYLRGGEFYGLKCFGIERDKEAAYFAQNELGINVIGSNLLQLDLPKDSFDVIHFRQVIEHLPKPKRYIRKIYELLKKGGVLIVETPNSQSLEHIPRLLFLDTVKKLERDIPYLTKTERYIMALQRKWAYVDPPRHLYGFDVKNLRYLLETNGFLIKKVLKRIIGDKIYNPIVNGMKADIKKEKRAAEKRLQQKSYFKFFVYRYGILPLMAIIKAYIYLTKNGNDLIIYAQKV